jgi:hypothetical protein
MSYTPGKGYRDGYNDRLGGQKSRCPFGSGTTDDPYWREYKEGYADADRKVMEDARSSINDKTRFLRETDPWSIGSNE